jgi:antitoxin (DNA-binding transcriptional repressor) of toxin-antitoxin stability system
MKKGLPAGRRRAISATAAAKTFGRLVDDVRSQRAEYIVERGGKPVVRIVAATEHRCTAADLLQVLRALPKTDEAYLKAVESGIAALNKPQVPENRWES